MSLLLDALQRASKEKEKLAGAASAESKALVAPKIAPASLLSAISAANKPVAEDTITARVGGGDVSNAAGTENPSALPALSFDFKIEVPPAEQPSAALLTVPGNAPESPASEAGGLSFTTEAIEPSAPLPEPLPPSAEPKAAYDFSNLAVSVEEVPAQESRIASWETAPVEEPAPVASPLVAEAPPPEPEPMPVATQPPAAPQPATPPPVTETHSSGSSDAARNLVETTTKSKNPKYKKRDVALVSLAIVVAALTASLFLGVWDTFLGIADSTAVAPSVVVEAQPPAPEPPAAPSEEELAPAPVADAASTESASTVPKFTVKTAQAESPVRSPAANTPPSNRKPLFTARAGGANALDTAYAALNEGRLDDAADAYRNALRRNSEERDALLGLAHIAQRKGQIEEARSYYRRVLRQDPDNATANAGLLSLASEGDLLSAASIARDMVERFPDSAAAFAALGNIQSREGRIADAQQAYFKAFSLEPDDPFHAYNLAVSLDRLHKTDVALGYYEKAIVLADKTGATTRRNFPRDAATLRIEQILAARVTQPMLKEAPGASAN